MGPIQIQLKLFHIFTPCFPKIRFTIILPPPPPSGVFMADPWIRVLLVKLIVVLLIMKIPSFYATQSFVTVFTLTRRWSLS
jgi:hypothetical protein